MLNKNGFSLIEIMIVLAIIALLSMLALPNVTYFLSKAKRTEVYIQLRNLYLLEKTYFLEHQEYTNKLTGQNSLNWDIKEGALYYTYGFTGAKNQNNIIGSLKTESNSLSGAHADKKSFSIFAAGDIDNDGESDILSIDQTGKIKIIKDDLS